MHRVSTASAAKALPSHRASTASAAKPPPLPSRPPRFMDLSVQLNRGSRSCKLEECLDLYVDEEELKGHDKVYCPKCKVCRPLLLRAAPPCCCCCCAFVTLFEPPSTSSRISKSLLSASTCPSAAPNA